NHPVVKKKAPAPKPLPPPQVTAENIADGSSLTGLVDWRAHTIGPVARVEFVVDGTVIASSTREPWETTWDTATVTPGPHRLEVDAAPVVGVGQPADQSGFLEPVEPRRHRSARELELVRELARRAAPVLRPEPQPREDAEVGMREVVLAEDLLVRALDAVVDARDPADDPLDVEVDRLHAGGGDARQQAVDAVLGCHARSVTETVLTSRGSSANL